MFSFLKSTKSKNTEGGEKISPEDQTKTTPILHCDYDFFLTLNASDKTEGFVPLNGTFFFQEQVSFFQKIITKTLLTKAQIRNECRNLKYTNWEYPFSGQMDSK